MKAPEKVSRLYMVLGILFCICLVAANLLETKVAQIAGFTITAGTLVFPVSYVLNDCITEVWGFRQARFIIWMGFLMNFFVLLLGAAAVALPGAPFWTGAEHFNFVFALAPRIAAASLAAFLAGSLLNAWVMARMKSLHHQSRFAWRAILSTLVGETVDSLIFFPLAFAGLMPLTELLKLMALQVTVKTLYEVIVLPLTTLLVRRLKQIEG